MEIKLHVQYKANEDSQVDTLYLLNVFLPYLSPIDVGTQAAYLKSQSTSYNNSII